MHRADELNKPDASRYDRNDAESESYPMFQRFFDEGLAQSSFLIACERTREAAIVDPRRDVDLYVTAARRRGLAIVYAIETHIHADFVSGARELSALGARVIAGPGAALLFDHHEPHDRQRLSLGDTTLTFLHTPGHTPEHISVLVDTTGEPTRVLTGDTLFVGAVGRPDLLGEELMRQLAGDLYESLTGKLLALGDEVEVHPGHGAGSLCGAGIGDEPHSTIGRERRFNAMLQHPSKASFVSAVLADLPETPPYFTRMKRVNHEGPTVLGLVDEVAPPSPLSAEEAAGAVHEGVVLVDLRPAEAFAKGHPRHAINIGFGQKVGYWAGWVIPPASPIILVANAVTDVAEARRQLLRVGLENVRGYVDGGFEAWRGAGLPVARIEQTEVGELADRLPRDEHLTLFDVRTRREFDAGHIDRAVHMPVGDVAARAAGLPVGQHAAVICEGGYRSSLAASLLARHGIPTVNVSGGMAAFRAQGTRR